MAKYDKYDDVASPVTRVALLMADKAREEAIEHKRYLVEQRELDRQAKIEAATILAEALKNNSRPKQDSNSVTLTNDQFQALLNAIKSKD